MLPALLFAFAFQAAGASGIIAVDVPVHYIAGHVFAVPRTRNGHTLKLLVDTGGAGGNNGMYGLLDTTVRSLNLKTRKITFGKRERTIADLPIYASDAAIPPSPGREAGVFLLPAEHFTPPDGSHIDGILGAGYLPGNYVSHDRIWTFDYPGKHLTLQGAQWQPPSGAHVTALHFPMDAQGHLEAGLPRVVIHVDGQPLSLLLDTGASGYPTPGAMEAEGGSATARATSYITTSIMDRWHRDHPDWRLMQQADKFHVNGQSMRAIEVPTIDIADWRIGPVWFTERPDANFIDGLSRYMDKQVVGAIGGNAFRHFVMTVDYRHAKAWFQCVKGCQAAMGETTAAH